MFYLSSTNVLLKFYQCSTKAQLLCPFSTTFLAFYYEVTGSLLDGDS